MVVGGGIAGIAAAVGLVERGVEVVLVEQHAQLGGRVRSWPVGHGAEQVTMSRGFHAFFRQYYNLRSLLRRVDPALERLVGLADYPLVLAEGHTDSFARIPRTPPLNLAAFVARSPSFTAHDLAEVDIGAALELLDVSFPETFSDYDGQSAAEFLDRLRFPDKARHLALEVFARSFFAHPSEFSAGELVAMFHSYFVGSSEGLLFDVPHDDYDTTFWAPLADYLAGRGAEVLTEATVDGIDLSMPERVTVVLRPGVLDSGQAITANAVVIATDPAATRRIVAGADGLGDESWRARIERTRNAAPFAVWRVWLDRLVDAERAPFLGTSGYGPLDNVTVLERFESGARSWSHRHRGSVVEMHAYALPAIDARGVSEHSVRAELWAQLNRVYPETRRAGILASEWLVEDDCPMIDPSPWRLRPEVTTPDRRIMLAGDQIRCDFPVALMERAATTGWLAANGLLRGWGLAGHDLWTVPMQGRHRAAGTARRLLAKASTSR
ncbi:MAG TPA: FAD-dependent oxidoreductase [Propionibacteriaceae bacterium]|nr:FAD-dependent oxidoreductase [Propionibacteriaceae bacterium]